MKVVFWSGESVRALRDDLLSNLWAKLPAQVLPLRNMDAPRLTINLRNMEVGFIGLGNMGLPTCKRLVAAQVHLKVFYINAQSVDIAVCHGAVATKSVAECASQVDVLFTSLPRPEHVEKVMVDSDALQNLKSGAI